VTDRCHFIWGQTFSQEQRDAINAWIGSGMPKPPPGTLRQKPLGDADWLYVPGCYPGAVGGPQDCVCATLEARCISAEDEVGRLRRQLSACSKRRSELTTEQRTLWIVLRRRGLGPLARRYATFRALAELRHRDRMREAAERAAEEYHRRRGR